MRKLLVVVFACLLFGCGSSGVSEPNDGDLDRESVEADSDSSSQDGDKETDASENSEGSPTDGDLDSDAESAAEQEATESEPLDGDSESVDGGDSDTEQAESSESSETPDGDSGSSSESDSEFEPYEIPAHKACTSDLDCPAWYSCDLNISICVIDQYAAPCSPNTECDIGTYTCSDSDAASDEGKCLPDASANRDEFSSNPLTGAEFTLPATCTKDSDCPVWYSCDLYRFKCASDANANPCYGNTFCQTNYECGARYYGDTVETQREKCTRQNDGGYCVKNSDCADGYTCDEQSKRCIECQACKACFSDSWCTDGLTCVITEGTMGKCDYSER